MSHDSLQIVQQLRFLSHFSRCWQHRAVCGVPTKNDLHATVMARFAHECLAKMNKLVVELETILGPGTADLALRIGLHSGPGKTMKYTYM